VVRRSACVDQAQRTMADPAPKPKIEDSQVAKIVKNIVLVVDYGSQYTQLITRRCGWLPSCTQDVKLALLRSRGLE
jgi:hypothetical protein